MASAVAGFALALGFIGCGDGAAPIADAEVDADRGCAAYSFWSEALTRCVACTEDAHCSGDDVCDAPAGRCVRCTADSDCPSVAPLCVENRCRTCAVSPQCPDRTASRCGVDNFCRACVDDADCAHIDGLPACREGVCVECSVRDTSACDGRVCDMRNGNCTERAPGTKGLCEVCVADEDCGEAMLCALSAGRLDVGIAHCFWRIDAPAPGPAGSCFAVRPHMAGGAPTTLNGAVADVCQPWLASCEALSALGSPCSDPSEPGAPAMSASCGTAAPNDGFCASGPTGNHCTTRCTAHYDCPCADADCRASYACVVQGDDFVGFCSATQTCTFPELDCT